MDIQKLKEKYDKLVIKKDGCWGWNGHTVNGGYSRFRFGKSMMYAHRASFILHHGDIPKGMQVCHRCDNPTCTNPKHLFLGTKADNIIDCMNKGRHPTLGKKGEENHRSILKVAQVKEIKDLLAKGLSSIDIGKMFGVHKNTINNIKYKLQWKEV